MAYSAITLKTYMVPLKFTIDVTEKRLCCDLPEGFQRFSLTTDTTFGQYKTKWELFLFADKFFPLG